VMNLMLHVEVHLKEMRDSAFPCEYTSIFSIVNFTVNSGDNYETNSLILSVYARNKNNFQWPIASITRKVNMMLVSKFVVSYLTVSSALVMKLH
jgi:hypothetical protein